jgi:hypothetical protein
MNQYCVFTTDKNFREVMTYISENKLANEPHLNRTRFWVPESMHTEFLKEWGSVCRYVHPEEDLTTGQRMDHWDSWKASKDLSNNL